jgi:hypothetical protein
MSDKPRLIQLLEEAEQQYIYNAAPMLQEAINLQAERMLHLSDEMSMLKLQLKYAREALRTIGVDGHTWEGRMAIQCLQKIGVG